MLVGKPLAEPGLVAVDDLACGIAVHVQVAVIAVIDVLLGDATAANVHIQRLERHDEAEELVAGRAHGANVTQRFVITKQAHKAGNTAFYHDLIQNRGIVEAALRAGLRNVVDHDGDRARRHIIGAFGFTGQRVWVIGFGGRSGGRCGCRGSSRRSPPATARKSGGSHNKAKQ
ncbi:hypothetical protein SDC9_178433 [bioreactor metagenome]|uniref:Uncharacterized protein n=1 Tax=bioreactor metagenome TaxID=1076179 RepID=A0A645GY37_9ZZZZ